MKFAKFGLFAVIFLFLCLSMSCGQEEQAADSSEDLSMLSLVPGDTVFFLGGLEPFPLQKVLEWNAGHFNMSAELNPLGMLKSEDDTEYPGQRMALHLWAEYAATAMDPETRLASWGFEAEPTFASYAIGLAPVLLRISLEDVQRFEAKVDELEQKARAEAKQEALGEATYRRYPLQDTEPHLDLIIGVDGNNAVFMLDVGIESEQTLAMALGQKKPDSSLARTGRLQSLQEKYELHPSLIGFMDHRQLMTGLTTTNGNRMAAMVHELSPKLKDASKGLAELRTDGCRNDLAAVADHWPQTVFGYTDLDLSGKPSGLDSLIAVECHDQDLLNELQSLRGFVPDYARSGDEQAVFSYGIGLNVDNVGSFLIKQWTNIVQKQYSCSVLQDMQQDLRAHNPALLTQALGMAAGVRGLALSLLSVRISETGSANGPMPEDVDALFSLSAKDPAALVHMASAMFPPLAGLQIPADGTPVSLPVPATLTMTPKAAIQGPHLTVYAGDRAERISKDLARASLESSPGFMAAEFDYSRYSGLLEGVVTSMDQAKAQNDQALAILEAMKDARIRFHMEMDFTDRGIEAHTRMTSME